MYIERSIAYLTPHTATWRRAARQRQRLPVTRPPGPAGGQRVDSGACPPVRGDPRCEQMASFSMVCVEPNAATKAGT